MHCKFLMLIMKLYRCHVLSSCHALTYFIATRLLVYTHRYPQGLVCQHGLAQTQSCWLACEQKWEWRGGVSLFLFFHVRRNHLTYIMWNGSRVKFSQSSTVLPLIHSVKVTRGYRDERKYEGNLWRVTKAEKPKEGQIRLGGQILQHGGGYPV